MESDYVVSLSAKESDFWMKGFLTNLLAIMLLAVLVSCAGAGSKGDLGKYIGDQINVRDAGWQPLSDIYCDGDNYVELQADGKCNFVMNGEKVDFVTWTHEDGQIVFSDEAQQVQIHGTVADGVLRIDDYADEIYKLTFVKEGATAPSLQDTNDSGNIEVEGDNIAAEEEDSSSSLVGSPAFQQAQALLAAAQDCEKNVDEQLDKISQQQNIPTQFEMNEAAYSSYVCWDNCLNAIWKILKSELPDDQMKQITKEQRAWISDKETATETVALDSWGGTLFSGTVSSEQAEWTKRRAYELTDYLKSIPNIVVHNELEFLKALGSDRVVTIAEGSNINLSNVLDLPELREQAGLETTEVSTDKPIKLPQGKYANQVFDGNELLLMNIKNLTIVGKGEKRPKIVVDPRYAYILNCVNCTNINIRHLEIGHTQTGSCIGGVLRFEACQQVSIDDCDMYGCGIEGITAKQTIDLRCARSIIRDCADAIMTVEQCKRMHFIDCQFTHNREFTLVNVDDESGVFFTKCRFTQNEGCLFSLKSFVHMNGCYVKHHIGDGDSVDDIGDRDYIIEKDCTWETY